MAITFASADTLKKKTKKEGGEFSFFGGAHPSTLKPADLYLMRVERDRSQQQHQQKRSLTESNSTSQAPDQDSLSSSSSSSSSINIAKRLRTTRADQGLLTYEDLTPEEKLNVVHKTFETQLKDMKKKRECILCHAEYTELGSLGKKDCVWHPGRAATGTWSCCGQATDVAAEIKGRSTGCSACDHTDKPYDLLKRNITEVPVPLALLAGVSRSEFLYEDTRQSNTLKRTCGILRATYQRVQYPKYFRPPLNLQKFQTGDLEALQKRFDFIGKRYEKEGEAIPVNTYATHITPALYL